MPARAIGLAEESAFDGKGHELQQLFHFFGGHDRKRITAGFGIHFENVNGSSTKCNPSS